MTNKIIKRILNPLSLFRVTGKGHLIEQISGFKDIDPTIIWTSVSRTPVISISINIILNIVTIEAQFVHYPGRNGAVERIYLGIPKTKDCISSIGVVISTRIITGTIIPPASIATLCIALAISHVVCGILKDFFVSPAITGPSRHRPVWGFAARNSHHDNTCIIGTIRPVYTFPIAIRIRISGRLITDIHNRGLRKDIIQSIDYIITVLIIRVKRVQFYLSGVIFKFKHRESSFAHTPPKITIWILLLCQPCQPICYGLFNLFVCSCFCGRNTVA